MTIHDSYEAFYINATANGSPWSKDQCLRLGFFSGYLAAAKAAAVSTGDMSDVEIERRYNAVKAELREVFSPESIAKFYQRPERVVKGKGA